MTPLELLLGLNDGDLLLFALPSFLPIYASNRGGGGGRRSLAEYGINEEAFIRNNATKRRDWERFQWQRMTTSTTS